MDMESLILTGMGLITLLYVIVFMVADNSKATVLKLINTEPSKAAYDIIKKGLLVNLILIVILGILISSYIITLISLEDDFQPDIISFILISLQIYLTLTTISRIISTDIRWKLLREEMRSEERGTDN